MKLILACGTLGLLALASYALNQRSVDDGTRSARPLTMAAVTPSDAPPFALVCQEEMAELRPAVGTPEADFLEEFFLVSDPRNLCRAGGGNTGFGSRNSRCYTLRAVGTGDPITPMACTEVFTEEKGALAVSQIRCNGGNRRLSTADDGSFRLAMGGSGVSVSRVSSGNCKPI